MAKSSRDLTFEHMLKIASGKEKFSAREFIPYSTDSEDWWLRVKTRDLLSNAKTFRRQKCKIHLNIADPERIAEAWDVIMPLLEQHADVVQSAKVLRADEAKKQTDANIKKAEKKARKLEFHEDDGFIYQTNRENLKEIAVLRAQEQRYLHSCNIVFYIHHKKDEALDDAVERFKSFFTVVEAALEEKEFKPGNVSQSDFPVTGFRFLSARVDRDKEGKYFRYNEKDKYDFVDDPLLKKFVAPEDLKKPSHQETKASPKLLNLQMEPKTDVIAEIRKIVNEESLGYWQEHTAGKEVVFNALMKLQECVDEKSTLSRAEQVAQIKKLAAEIQDASPALSAYHRKQKMQAMRPELFARRSKQKPTKAILLCAAILALMLAKKFEGTEQVKRLTEEIREHNTTHLACRKL